MWPTTMGKPERNEYIPHGNELVPYENTFMRRGNEFIPTLCWNLPKPKPPKIKTATATPPAPRTHDTPGMV